MPAYNAASTVGAAVASVLRQTEPRLEVVVVDDASADGTAAVVARLAAQDGRVRLIKKGKNRGPASARNCGFDAARGEWIALLDADDEFEPQRIERLLHLGEKHEADLVADNLLLCDASGRQPRKPMISPQHFRAAHWMTATEFVAGNVGSRFAPRVSYGFLQPLIRRSFLERHKLRYDEHNRFGEDFLLALRSLLFGARWWITPEPMYLYTVRFGSLTDVQAASDLMRIRSYEEELLRAHPMVQATPELAAALRRHKRVIEHFYYYRAFTDALKAGRITPALHLLLESRASFRHIVSESLLQGPRVAFKALRGGYRRPLRTVTHVRSTSMTQNPGRQA
jgi:glycosyltransferase involved in cell wall biosynthesis